MSGARNLVCTEGHHWIEMRGFVRGHVTKDQTGCKGAGEGQYYRACRELDSGPERLQAALAN